MNGGYPALSDIITYLAAEGIEELTEGNTNFRQEFMQYLWSLLNRTSFAAALGVWLPSATTFNVRGGRYLYKGVIKTYTPGSAIDPTDNDTTYIWLKSDNSIDSGIDGDGWPTTEHIRLAEIVVDSDGIITGVTDLRGQTFMPYIGNYIVEAGSSVEILPVHWDSSSPADDDEMRMPFYAENSAGEKTEYARLVVKLTDVTDGTEDAQVSLMAMIAGTLTDIGQLVGLTATQTLTNKTIDGDDNTVQDLPLTAIKTDVGNASKFLERDASGIPVNGKSVPTGDVVGSSDSQTLTNKTLTSPVINTPVTTRTIEAHTAGDTLTAAESGSVHTNLGATGAVTLILPASAPAGTQFTFAVQAAYELRIDPGTATIRDDSGQTADKYKSADAIGECITLIADANGDWATNAKNGTWTEEA